MNIIAEECEMSKKLLFSCSLAVLAVVSCLGVSSCKKEGASYQTERIAQGDIVQKITASGIINPISTVDIGTQV